MFQVSLEEAWMVYYQEHSLILSVDKLPQFIKEVWQEIQDLLITQHGQRLVALNGKEETVVSLEEVAVEVTLEAVAEVQAQ